jgi:hypothetical protein
MKRIQWPVHTRQECSPPYPITQSQRSVLPYPRKINVTARGRWSSHEYGTNDMPQTAYHFNREPTFNQYLHSLLRLKIVKSAHIRTTCELTKSYQFFDGTPGQYQQYTRMGFWRTRPTNNVSRNQLQIHTSDLQAQNNTVKNEAASKSVTTHTDNHHTHDVTCIRNYCLTISKSFNPSITALKLTQTVVNPRIPASPHHLLFTYAITFIWKRGFPAHQLNQPQSGILHYYDNGMTSRRWSLHAFIGWLYFC